MAYSVTIAAEILCHIFYDAVTVSEEEEMAALGGFQEFAHPPLRQRFKTAVVLTHICRQWRRVATDFPVIWNGVYLTQAMCLQGYQHISKIFLKRSKTLPLRLDIRCVPNEQAGAAPLPTTHWAKILGTQVLSRCTSLRLIGAEKDLQSVLDVFTEYNSSFKSSSSQFIPLKELEVAQPYPRRSTIAVPPFNLASISPNIVSLRCIRASFSTFPQWSMEEIVLQDIGLERDTFRNLIASSGVKKLVLRRAVIYEGFTWDRMSLADQAKWVEHYTDHTRLEYLELDSLIDHRCTTQRTLPPGVYEDPHIHYYNFFLETLIPHCTTTLKTLKLTSFSSRAWDAFKTILRSRLEVVFSEVKTLALHNIPIRVRRRHGLFDLQVAFPDVERLSLTGMERQVAHILLRDRALNAGANWASLRECCCEENVHYLDGCS